MFVNKLDLLKGWPGPYRNFIKTVISAAWYYIFCPPVYFLKPESYFQPCFPVEAAFAIVVVITVTKGGRHLFKNLKDKIILRKERNEFFKFDFDWSTWRIKKNCSNNNHYERFKRKKGVCFWDITRLPNIRAIINSAYGNKLIQSHLSPQPSRKKNLRKLRLIHEICLNFVVAISNFLIRSQCLDMHLRLGRLEISGRYLQFPIEIKATRAFRVFLGSRPRTN